MDAAWAGAGRFTIFSVAVTGMAFSGFDKFIDRASLANPESLDSVRRGGWSLYSDVGLQKKMAPAGERAVTLTFVRRIAFFVECLNTLGQERLKQE